LNEILREKRITHKYFFFQKYFALALLSREGSLNRLYKNKRRFPNQHGTKRLLNKRKKSQLK